MNAITSSESAIDAQLQQALEQHKAKQYGPAEQSYRTILAVRPYHPIANHNLGLLAGQQGRHLEALPLLRSAWSINPDEGQFWLSYAAGLLKAQQPDEALKLMQDATAQGLTNDEARALLAAAQTAVDERNRHVPTPDETAQVIALYQAGQYEQLEHAARHLQERYPQSGFASSVLGTALQCQGKDALAVLLRTVELTPLDPEAHGNAGNALQDIGKYEQALAYYHRALELQPEFAEAHNNMAGALQALARHDEAAQSYRRAIAANPRYAVAYFNLGNTLAGMGDLSGAVTQYLAALELDPLHVEAHCNLGNAYQMQGGIEAASASYRRTIELNPQYLHALINLANSLLNDGNIAEASRYFQLALELHPDSAEANMRVGLSLHMQERFEDALPPLRRAAELDPTALDTQIWLARTLHAAGYKEESVQCYRSALTLRPNDAALYNQLGIALHDSGDSEAAITAYRRAIELEPELAQAHSNIGVAQFHLKRYEEALASYRQALAIEPDFAVCRANLGIFLRAQGQLEAAIEEFRHARTIRPDYLDAHINLSAALSEAGKLVEAVEACYAALEINPDFMHVHSNLLFCLSHLSASDPAALFAEHLRFGARFETPLMRHWPAHSNDRDPERMLRIGFVSGDFNRHAVANFIVPVFEFLTRSPRLSLYAYYTHNEIDATTQRVKTCLGNWRQVDGRSDEELAEQIRDDAIDILIDLSGHTDKNRLLVFARKPAPVQVTWIGYPGTTGLKSMDYFLTDRHLLPPEFSSQFTEAFAYIPASAPFLPSGEAPETNALPALTNGYVTFGSFNRANKLSREVIDLWSALLHAVPNSRLLLAAMPHNTDHQIFVDWFEENGIGGERLSFAKRSDMKAYLQMHHQVDVALDTFPYTGGTTTLHALWMGVPVLTLAGATTAGRTSAAILSHVQLEAFIAHTQAQFVERGTYISNNLPLLAGIRASMRQFMASSAMGQPDLIAIGFEGAMRAMWHRWCAGLPPEMLEVELDPHGAN